MRLVSPGIITTKSSFFFLLVVYCFVFLVKTFMRKNDLNLNDQNSAMKSKGLFHLICTIILKIIIHSNVTRCSDHHNWIIISITWTSLMSENYRPYRLIIKKKRGAEKRGSSRETELRPKQEEPRTEQDLSQEIKVTRYQQLKESWQRQKKKEEIQP